MVILKERVISTDSDLLSLISDLKTRVVPIETLKSADDVINQAMLNTATDTHPEDLDEVMEWVFGDYEGDMVSEEESDDG